MIAVDDEAAVGLDRGITPLAAQSRFAGPRGRTSCSRKLMGAPTITNDGVSIAK